MLMKKFKRNRAETKTHQRRNTIILLTKRAEQVMTTKLWTLSVRQTFSIKKYKNQYSLRLTTSKRKCKNSSRKIFRRPRKNI